MTSLNDIQTAFLTGQPIAYECTQNLNLYDSSELKSLATQAIEGRQLWIVGQEGEAKPQVEGAAIWVRLCEDDYPGWVAIEDLDLLEKAMEPYQAIPFSEAEICDRLPKVIAFTHEAMLQPNHYLWGGTVGPNYDCSGLMQTAFASVGIWLPRDAYQQADFTQPIALEKLQPGDLIFFKSKERVSHVGLYLGEGYYIHSSGKDQGRNGIAIDSINEPQDAIAQAYKNQICGAGRVVASY